MGNKKPPAGHSGGRFCNSSVLAADNVQHLADILHGLGQVLHDLHSIITSKVRVCCFYDYRLPMQADISPMFCMVLMMFFIVILISSKSCVWIVFRSDADLVQHLAVVGHVLNQILDNNVLHSINTSKIEWEKFLFFAGSDVPLNQAWGYYSTVFSAA